MTFKEAMQKRLVEHGLWENEAEIVVKEVMSDELSPFKDRWNDNPENYPTVAAGILWAGVKRKAISYLKENKPNHFALMILEPERK